MRTCKACAGNNRHHPTARRGARAGAWCPAIVHSRPYLPACAVWPLYGTARRGAHVEHYHQGESKRGEKVSLSSDLIRYIATLRLSQGRYAGDLFPIQTWQRKFIKGVFSQPDDGAMSLARGGGKSTFSAAIASAAVDVDGPLVERNACCLVVASSFAQGGVIFGHMLKFLQPTFEAHGVGGRGRFRLMDSQNVAAIIDKETGANVKVMGSDPRRLHAHAPKISIYDEVAQWEPGKLPAMLAALNTSRGKIPDSKALWIGTRPSSAEHPFERALSGEGTGFALCFKAEQDDDPFARRTWKKANPGLDNLPDLEAVISSEAEIAKKSPEALQTFKALRLNMGVADVLYSTLISSDNWRIVEDLGDPEPEADARFVMALDLGTSQALSAASGFFHDGRLEAFAVLPEIPSLEDKGRNDGVGNLYERMHERGELLIAGRRISDIKALLNEARSRWGRPVALVVDAHRKAELLDCLEAAEFPRCQLIVRKQHSVYEAGEDVRLFRKCVLSELVRPSRSLLLRHCLSEARTVVDATGQARLARQTQGGRRAEARDDAAAASILAVAEGWRRWHAKPEKAGGRRRRYYGAVA